MRAEERVPDGRAGDLTKRMARITSVLAKHGARELFGRGPSDLAQSAASLRLALEELGPTFAKLGQILSTRPDLLPPVFIAELEKLQDKVPPLTEAAVVSAIETALGVPWEDAFASIEPTPLAAGTIAQVHRAVLENGDQVVVKVQRPTAASQIISDLELLKLFAEKSADRTAFNRMIDVPSVVDHLSEGLRKELDFRVEASNIARMRQVLADYPRLSVPRVYDAFTCETLMVMEFVAGVPLRQAPDSAERKEAARQFLESYYRQVLSEGFFHADPHPGNLLWCDGAIWFLDFGMVGELDAGLRDTLLVLVMALWQEDTPFLVEALLTLSERDPDIEIDLEGLTLDLEAILKRHRHLSLKELELGPLLTEITTIAIKHDVRLPASLLLTSKALAQMQLVTAELDPTLDPFAVAGSYITKHIFGKMRDRVSPTKMLYEGSKLRTRFNSLFTSVEGLLAGARHGRLQVQFRGLERLEDAIGRAGRRLAVSLVATASLTGAAITSTSNNVPQWITPVEVGIGAIFGLILLWDLLRKT